MLPTDTKARHPRWAVCLFCQRSSIARADSCCSAARPYTAWGFAGHVGSTAHGDSRLDMARSSGPNTRKPMMLRVGGMPMPQPLQRGGRLGVGRPRRLLRLQGGRRTSLVLPVGAMPGMCAGECRAVAMYVRRPATACGGKASCWRAGSGRPSSAFEGKAEQPTGPVSCWWHDVPARECRGNGVSQPPVDSNNGCPSLSYPWSLRESAAQAVHGRVGF